MRTSDNANLLVKFSIPLAIVNGTKVPEGIDDIYEISVVIAVIILSIAATRMSYCGMND